MADKTLRFSISLYESQYNKIKKYVKESKNFNSDSSFFQHIINSYFKRKKSSLTKNIALYLIYPIIFCIFSLFGSISTQNLQEILLGKDIYFAELFYLNRTFTVLGFGTLGFLLASIYLLYKFSNEEV